MQMRKFVYKTSYHIAYKKQGYIFFCCQNYNTMSSRLKKKIDRLCAEVGKENAKALFEALTAERSAELTAARYFLSCKSIYKMMHEFFRRW